MVTFAELGRKWEVVDFHAVTVGKDFMKNIGMYHSGWQLPV